MKKLRKTSPIICFTYPQYDKSVNFCHAIFIYSFVFIESEVYEDPRVLYELLEENPEPITKESYLVIWVFYCIILDVQDF